MMTCFEKRTALPVSAWLAYAWHDRPGAFARLVPPWEDVRVIGAPPRLQDGATAEMDVGLGPLRRRWVAEVTDVEPGVGFTDVQRTGPFARWVHRHRFEPDGDSRCYLVDQVSYQLPLGFLGRMGSGWVGRKLDRMFAWRHDVTKREVSSAPATARRVLVTGSSGLVGSALLPYLETRGVEAIRGERDAPPPPADAVVHLAGENIARRRWTRRQKERIRSSRVELTRKLCERLAAMPEPPRVLVCASAVAPEGGFLADVVREWEAACQPARDAGIRVVNLRFGVILDPRQGALAKMLTPFRLGLGGRIGTGRQRVAWVSREDAVRAVHHAVEQEDLSGPVEVVAPQSVTNRELTRTLGAVLRRPAVLPVPGVVARLAFGEVAKETLLADLVAAPDALSRTGFEFVHPDLETALRDLLGRPAS